MTRMRYSDGWDTYCQDYKFSNGYNNTNVVIPIEGMQKNKAWMFLTKNQGYAIKLR